MIDVTASKNIGSQTALLIIDAKGAHEYTVEYYGSSANYKGVADNTAIHLRSGAETTHAETILAAIQKPTCTFSLLQITTNVGSYISGDTYDVTADADEKKWILTSVAIDDTTGVFEVLAFERLDSAQYGDVPAGKTLAGNLKEFSVVALGTELIQENNYIR